MMQSPQSSHALLLAWFVWSGLVSAAQVNPAPAAPPAPSETRATYNVSVGDVLDLKFYYNPALNETVTVRPDGFISLQLIGDVRAEGLPPVELARIVDDLYAKVIQQPRAVVIVKEFAGRQIYVGGEVNNPRLIPLRGRLTATQAVLDAGGAKVTAHLKDVILLRQLTDGKAEVRKLDFSRAIRGKEDDPVLQPYDVVFIPRSAIAKVGIFVQQYVNDLVPRALLFPYNLNSIYTVR